jgi:subtilisin family serine protease
MTYNIYDIGSGTSFAAPHVAAVAAYLSMAQGLSASTAIENAVRNTFYTNWQTDLSGRTIYYSKIQ